MIPLRVMNFYLEIEYQFKESDNDTSKIKSEGYPNDLVEALPPDFTNRKVHCSLKTRDLEQSSTALRGCWSYFRHGKLTKITRITRITRIKILALVILT